MLYYTFIHGGVIMDNKKISKKGKLTISILAIALGASAIACASCDKKKQKEAEEQQTAQKEAVNEVVDC